MLVDLLARGLRVPSARRRLWRAWYDLRFEHADAEALPVGRYRYPTSDS